MSSGSKYEELIIT